MFSFFPSAFKKRAKKSPPGGQNDPQERPGRSQERPKRPQDGPKTAPNAARSAPRGAKTAPRAPKSLGRCSKNFGSVLQGRPGAPKTRQEPFGRPSGPILASFWESPGPCRLVNYEVLRPGTSKSLGLAEVCRLKTQPNRWISRFVRSIPRILRDEMEMLGKSSSGSVAGLGALAPLESGHRASKRSCLAVAERVG